MPSFCSEHHLGFAAVVLNQQNESGEGLKKDFYFTFTQGWRIPFFSSPCDTSLNRVASSSPEPT